MPVARQRDAGMGKGAMKFARAAICAMGVLSTHGATADPAAAFTALSYDISLTPDFATGTVSGVERLRFRSLTDDLQDLSFTADPLAVSATLDGMGGVTVSTGGGRRTFHLPRSLAKGETGTLVMRFSGQPKRDVVFTSGEIHTGYFTCEVMICDIDRPGDRATLRFALTIPAGMEAVAPGKRVSRTPAALACLLPGIQSTPPE